eukprot:5311256-Alexandrium_andersonii.AAC.1
MRYSAAGLAYTFADSACPPGDRAAFVAVATRVVSDQAWPDTDSYAHFPDPAQAVALAQLAE